MESMSIQLLPWFAQSRITLTARNRLAQKTPAMNGVQKAAATATSTATLCTKFARIQPQQSTKDPRPTIPAACVLDRPSAERLGT